MSHQDEVKVWVDTWMGSPDEAYQAAADARWAELIEQGRVEQAEAARAALAKRRTQ